MEYIDGKELKNKIEADPIPNETVINIANQIVEELDANPNNEISLPRVLAINVILGLYETVFKCF